MAAKSLSRRVADLEGREEMVYSFMEDLRKWTMQIQAERIEIKAQIRELQISHGETREMIRAVNVLHADSQKRIAENEKTLKEIKSLVEIMDKRLIFLENRQNGSKH